MNLMNLKIDTDEPIKVRQAAHLLGGFTLLDDAFNMTEESAIALVEWLNDIHPERSLGNELQKLGRELLKPNTDFNLNEPLDPLLMDVVTQAYVNSCASEDDLELVGIAEGSIRGQFRKKFKDGWKRISRAFSAIKDLVPSQDANGFKEAAAAALNETYSNKAVKETSGGLTVVAAAAIHNVLRDVNATEVSVGDDDEDVGLLLSPSTA